MGHEAPNADAIEVRGLRAAGGLGAAYAPGWRRRRVGGRGSRYFFGKRTFLGHKKLFLGSPPPPVKVLRYA